MKFTLKMNGMVSLVDSTAQIGHVAPEAPAKPNHLSRVACEQLKQ